MDVRRILIIDDTAMVRKLASAVLQASDYKVSLAASGEEGLAIARSEKPDLILLDVMMPDVDGPETLQRLRTDPETQAIPVVFLTARALDEEREQWRALGAIGVISKRDVGKLPEALRRVLDEER